jgi:hypothetical protein
MMRLKAYEALTAFAESNEWSDMVTVLKYDKLQLAARKQGLLFGRSMKLGLVVVSIKWTCSSFLRSRDLNRDGIDG